jgi:hypothetical protein
MGYLGSGVEGYVMDKLTGTIITGATIRTNTGIVIPNESDGYYWFTHAAGIINMYCEAPNCKNWQRLAITLYEGKTKFLNIKMTKTP